MPDWWILLAYFNLTVPSHMLSSGIPKWLGYNFKLCYIRSCCVNLYSRSSERMRIFLPFLCFKLSLFHHYRNFFFLSKSDTIRNKALETGLWVSHHSCTSKTWKLGWKVQKYTSQLATLWYSSLFRAWCAAGWRSSWAYGGGERVSSVRSWHPWSFLFSDHKCPHLLWNQSAWLIAFLHAKHWLLHLPASQVRLSVLVPAAVLCLPWALPSFSDWKG